MADNSSNTTIVVAVLSLVGVLGAAVISNWDRLMPRTRSEQPSASVGTLTTEPPLAATPKQKSPAESVSPPIESKEASHSPEDILLGHWVSTFENPLFSVIEIARDGSKIHLRAYVNNRGPDKGGCVYDTVIDGKRGVVARGKKLEWQLPTLPLPCANWVSPGFTGASLMLATPDGDTLPTVVTMYVNQSVIGGSGPQTYARR